MTVSWSHSNIEITVDNLINEVQKSDHILIHALSPPPDIYLLDIFNVYALYCMVQKEIMSNYANCGISKSKCFNGNENQMTGKERRAVAILAVVFLVVFTSFTSIQNLQSSINEVDGLGVTSLMCLYIAALISCTFSPLAIRLSSAKGVIIVCCVVHLLYACSNLYPRFWTIIPTSLLLGCVTGPFWTAQGMYVTTCAFQYADRSKKDLGHTLGRYFSTFSIIYVWSYIIGNIMVSILLNLDNVKIPDDQIYSNVSTALNTSLNATQKPTHRCAVHYCPDFSESETPASQHDNKYLYYLLGLFVACVAIGLGIAIFLLPPIPKMPRTTNSNRRVLSSLTSCGRLLADPTMSLLCPSILAFSWAEGLRWSDISHVSA